MKSADYYTLIVESFERFGNGNLLDTLKHEIESFSFGLRKLTKQKYQIEISLKIIEDRYNLFVVFSASKIKVNPKVFGVSHITHHSTEKLLLFPSYRSGVEITIYEVPEIEEYLKQTTTEYDFWRILEEFAKEIKDEKKETSEGS
jgi:hypothetical protein